LSNILSATFVRSITSAEEEYASTEEEMIQDTNAEE